MSIKIIVDGHEIELSPKASGQAETDQERTEIYLHGNLILTRDGKLSRDEAQQALEEHLGVSQVNFEDTVEEKSVVKYYFSLPVAEKG